MVNLLLQAAGTFVVTNIDDIVVLSLFFARVGNSSKAKFSIVAGQYLGFSVLLALSVGFARAAELLPQSLLPYLGLLPLAMGLRAAWVTWRQYRDRRKNHPAPQALDDDTHRVGAPANGPASAWRGLWQTAMVTLANGGDNLGVYVPIFATARASEVAIYIAVFLAGVGLWCLAGYLVVSRPTLAGLFERWGHVMFSLALIIIGSEILISGGAFGL